ncbi:hypothetical protein [Buchnera aphidicola]|uniref:hypothetical protein n=1 Tax=Buchnera aphidicola TaxID=9 RepID=UPI0030EF2B2F
MSLILNISTIKKKIFSNNINFVCLNGIEGGLSIYPKHAPLITLLKSGIIKINIYEKNNQKNIYFYLYISKGLLEVQPNFINIFIKFSINSYDDNLKNKFFLKKNYLKKKILLKKKNNLNFKKISLKYEKIIQNIKILNFLKNMNILK